MFVRNRDSSLIEVAGKFRVQKGPRRFIAKATPELLDDAVTAKHYYAGTRPMRARDMSGQPITVDRAGIDCRNNPIVLGQDCELIDWRCRKRNPVWRIYELARTDEVVMVSGPHKGQKLLQPRWFLPEDHSEFDSEDAALANVLERLGISPKAALGEKMVFLADDVLDNGLEQLNSLVDRFDICSAEPANYTEATSTNTLGNKDHGAAGSAFGAPQDGDTSGRKVASTAVTDGSVTATGTATHWAASDVANTTLYAAQSLSSSQAVTSGNTWAMPSLDIEIPDPS